MQWEVLLERDPSIGELFAGPADLAEWLTSAEALLATYFTLEDPTRLEPRERELLVSTELDEDGPQLRGIIDRVDVAPNGWVRVVDYKTGKSPRAGFESSALFQMRFYAYVIWRTRGVLPKRLQLEYLGDGVVLTHEPSESEMATIEARVRSIWGGIEDAARSRRLAAQAVEAVRLVLVQGAVPGVRRGRRPRCPPARSNGRSASCRRA